MHVPINLVTLNPKDFVNMKVGCDWFEDHGYWKGTKRDLHKEVTQYVKFWARHDKVKGVSQSMIDENVDWLWNKIVEQSNKRKGS